MTFQANTAPGRLFRAPKRPANAKPCLICDGEPHCPICEGTGYLVPIDGTTGTHNPQPRKSIWHRLAFLGRTK